MTWLQCVKGCISLSLLCFFCGVSVPFLQTQEVSALAVRHKKYRSCRHTGSHPTRKHFMYSVSMQMLITVPVLLPGWGRLGRNSRGKCWGKTWVRRRAGCPWLLARADVALPPLPPPCHHRAPALGYDPGPQQGGCSPKQRKHYACCIRNCISIWKLKIIVL